MLLLQPEALGRIVWHVVGIRFVFDRFELLAILYIILYFGRRKTRLPFVVKRCNPKHVNWAEFLVLAKEGVECLRFNRKS